MLLKTLLHKFIIEFIYVILITLYVLTLWFNNNSNNVLKYIIICTFV